MSPPRLRGIYTDGQGGRYDVVVQPIPSPRLIDVFGPGLFRAPDRIWHEVDDVLNEHGVTADGRIAWRDEDGQA
jgi:hypothetical protein